MTILTKLKALTGQPLYEYYTEVLRRLGKEQWHSTYYPTRLQLRDWLFLDATTEGCLVRSCGGSKTLDVVNWLVLRCVLRPKERWAWVAAAMGQLNQARLYFMTHPFVKAKHGSVGNESIELWNGTHILLRGATKSITGLRLDGIILDEEEMLDPKQVTLVYPQLSGRLTNSSVGKFFHLGTMEVGTLFMDNLEQYPTMVTAWDQCPWLVKAGNIQRYIDDGVKPKHEIDLLYRCIPTSPHGVVFPNLTEQNLSNTVGSSALYGMDFGATDHCVGVYIKGKDLYILDEWEFSLEDNNKAFDFLAGQAVEAESGGYNDSDKYAAKSKMMMNRIGASKQPVTNKWKAERVMMARGLRIHADKNRTPGVYKDLKACIYGPDGQYLKDRSHPCHWVDAFLHAVDANGSRYIGSGKRSNGNSIRKREAAREARLTYR